MKNLIGKVVGGCQIVSEIAEGGMGVVYRAKQLSLEREVALKVLADRLAGDPSFVERFQREARAIARVNHPNILAVYDVGQDPELSLHYMIMELVDGRSLSDIIKDKGVLPPRDASEFIRQAALGLACAQGAGIVHRDVKPENLMVTLQNVIKVSDFGLAKEVGGSTMTATDSVMGTPAYMSPEQCDGKKLDGRTDIYSLGGSFYHLITGRLPFEAETAMSMMYRHKHEPVIPPKQIVPAIQLGISSLIVKMMAKRREDRLQTMDEIAKAIEQALAEDGGSDTQRTATITGVAMNQPMPTAPGAAAGLPIELGATNPRRRELERLIAQGDARQRRGDLGGAVRLWREAKAIHEDPRIQERMEQFALPEAEKAKVEGESRIAEGQLSEASRLYRQAMELNPDDQDATERLQEIEERLAKRREAVNQVRQLLASNRYEDAIAAWEELPEDFRDESLVKQIAQVRDVILPVMKLCDQGEEAMQSGDLEKAVTLFSRAGDVDNQSERAKTGLRETERRLGRVERMLKEGYEFNVKEDYERAIGAWTGILKVAPNHAQARKLIIDARLRIGHAHRQRDGGLQNAISQWKEILKLDPEHRMALALIEQDEASHGTLSGLGAEAQAYFSSGKHGKAIACWRQMLDIDPTNRRLSGMIAQARKLRRKRRITRLVVFLVVVVVGGVGGQFAREFMAVRAAETLKNKNQPLEAATKLEAFSYPILLRGTMKKNKRSYTLIFYLTAASKARIEKNFEESLSLYDRARLFADPQDTTVDAGVIQTRWAQIRARAEDMEAEKKWNAAIRLHHEALEMAKAQDMKREVREAEESVEFATMVDGALRAEADGRFETARDYWLQARTIKPDHIAVKLAVERLGIQP
jgi:tetratricopeptide (TPR) repeat protein